MRQAESGKGVDPLRQYQFKTVFTISDSDITGSQYRLGQTRHDSVASIDKMSRYLKESPTGLVKIGKAQYSAFMLKQTILYENIVHLIHNH